MQRFTKGQKVNDFELMIRKTLPTGLNCDVIQTIQLNLGRHCNLTCSHCHLECSPLRRELMTEPVMEDILSILGKEKFLRIDITGGAPELHPRFRDLVDRISRTGNPVQVRTNLVALMDRGLTDLIRFFRERQISLVASLPCYLQSNVDAQRGRGVHDRSIEALRSLNEAGYGIEGNLELSIVFNPGGPVLPPAQKTLEAAYRDELGKRFGIAFSRLIVLTNMPLGRFRQQLEKRGDLGKYMQMLVKAYNPATLPGLMCRHQVCIDWDGTLFDCDFNLALGISVNHGAPRRVAAFDKATLLQRKIVTGPHCFGCTAGAGSSCAGALAGSEDPACHPEAPGFYRSGER